MPINDAAADATQNNNVSTNANEDLTAGALDEGETDAQPDTMDAPDSISANAVSDSTHGGQAMDADTGSVQMVNIPEGDRDTISTIGENYNNIINVLLLIAIFVLAKFIFTRFLMKAKKSGGTVSENFAYSISVFSLFISLSIILTSVIYGNMPVSLTESIIKLLVYSLLGISLLIISGLIFDRIALTKISISKEIANGNIAASIIDTGNFIASALIIAAALKWYEFKSLEGITAILCMYLCSQVILTIATLIRKAFFKYSDDSVNFEQQISQGNNAVAIDFAGRRIGTALAITAATNIMPYQEGYSLSTILSQWFIASIIIVVFFNVVSWVASRIILWEKDIHGDIVRKNINTALADAAIFISFGLILSSTLM